MDWEAAKMLQHFPGNLPWDHVPLVFFPGCNWFGDWAWVKQKVHERWDLEALASCLQHGKLRIEFLTELRKQFTKEQAKGWFDEVGEELACDEHWRRWMTVVRRVALTFSSASKKAHYCDEKYTKFAADRVYGEDRDEPIDANWEMRSCLMFNSEENDDELGGCCAESTR